MNPDAPSQVFVLLLALTAAGVVVATIVESGVLAESAATAVSELPSAEFGGAELGDLPTERSSGGAQMVARVDSELIDSLGSGAGSGATDVDGTRAAETGGSEEADVPTEAPGPDTAAAPADPAWEPLRRGTASEPCLVRANRAVVATGVRRREPTGTEGPFMANGEPIVLFLDLANATGVTQELTAVWTQGSTGASYLDTVDAGPGSRWRTWAERPLPLDQIGRWNVEVVDSERCLVAAVSFELSAPQW